MAAPAHNTNSVSPDTPITIKISVNDGLKKLKLPLRDLGANVLLDKLRVLLSIAPEQTVTFERFSDSAGGYITLDSNNPQVFKTLIRAAKAKLKLRLKATITPLPGQESVQKEDQVVEEKMSSHPVDPVIVSSPAHQNNARDSTALDGRSIGSGIFQFREARASQQTLVDTSEAPVPQPFNAGQSNFFSDLVGVSQGPEQELALRSRPPIVSLNNNGHAWSVYCNECDVAMADAHFHCGICDDGDYDVCESCVASGKFCPGDDHWLIKRFIKDGKVINSTTERVSLRNTQPAQPIETDIGTSVPGAFAEDTKTLAVDPPAPTRTCNSCVVVREEHQFVTCTSCDDFDLCIECHTNNKHGHHPAHGFKPATVGTVLPRSAASLLPAGRNVLHDAICDGCDKKIMGVRHKCLICPDWDYCNDCIKAVNKTHPRHRFAPIYEPIPHVLTSTIRHNGIYCDGPLCKDRADDSYITGVRYKCAVCHNTDFCASCEALPSNTHNRTHPLIKFKTPVRGVSITTENEDARGAVRLLGDRRTAPSQAETRSTSTETVPVQQANAATQVRTMAEIKPTVVESAAKSIPIIKSNGHKAGAALALPGSASLLSANFVHDSIQDGMVMHPGARFTQIWTMRNPGPWAWPAGCSVRFVGGDNMLNIDNNHPSSLIEINSAKESNVIGREVQVGEDIAFKVVLKAPMREGKAISYWRLKSAEGVAFGHRLWCDITVQKPTELSSAPQAAAVPDASQVTQAQLLRMQAMRQQQLLMQHQQMLAQQVQQRTNVCQQPNYEAHTNSNIPARIAAMREAQAKRREHMMAQFHSHRDQPQVQGVPREDHSSSSQTFNPSTGIETQPSDEEKARKEAAKQRVEHIKAKILRAREEKAKVLEAAREEKAKLQAAQKALLKEATESDAAVRKSREESAKVQKIIEEVNKNAEAEADEDVEDEDSQGSQMIFPKLEKESPASSTYQSVTSSGASGKGRAAYVENENGEIERSATPTVAPASVPATPAYEEGFEDLNDDLEVFSADGEQSDDDGFVTDEEYDILDASDQETVASK